MQYKYAPNRLVTKTGKPVRKFPNNWCSGPDPLMHDMYYAWSKHRSQAHYRGEPHELTWEDWQTIFANPNDFLNRGRQPENLVLTRLDIDQAWSLDNCQLITRYEQLIRDIASKERKPRNGKNNILHKDGKDGTKA